MEKLGVAQHLIDSVAKKSGVEAAEVQKVLETLGLHKVAQKIEDLHHMLQPANASKLGSLSSTASKVAAAVDPAKLDLANLSIEYRLHGIDGFAHSVNA